MPKVKNFLSKEIKKELNFLLDSQYWSKSNLESLQIQKLRKLIDYTYDNIPYYHDLFNELNLNPKSIQNFDDLKKIPILTKADIKNNFERLIDPKLDKKKLVLNSTGGSTGIPLRLYHDKNYMNKANAMRIRNWKYFVGFNENESEGILWGDIRDIGNSLSFKDIIRFIIKPDLRLNTFDIDKKKFLRFFRLFNILKPKILRGYSSSLYFAAEFLQELDMKVHSPKSIVSSAERLSKKMRVSIEKVFNSEVYDSYGAREVSQVAMECKFHKMHISEENQIVELISNNETYGKDLKNIVITNLNNFCMPIIRYEIGDLAQSLSNESCGCGRNMSLLNGLAGRENENIILNNGKVVNGEYFEFLFEDITQVDRYQVLYIKSKDTLEFRLSARVNRNYIEDFLIKKIKEHLKIANVKIIFTKDFLKSPSGNFKFVWSE